MHTTRVAVVRGGPSEEYEVSLNTGEHVLSSLNRRHYESVDIVVTKAGEWLRHGRARTPHEALSGVDVVFIALHGTYGEDGTVQRMLEQLGIPYVGSGPYSSAIAMNKAMAKDRVQHHGVLLPRHVMLSPDVLSSLQSTVEDIISLFGPHYIIKPVTGGSSIGTRRALGEHELSHALSQALRSYEQVLVEELITGREATVGVIDNYRGVPLYTLPPVEIRTAPSGLFDYENKYGDESLEHCPSHFSHQTKVELERLARTVHSALDLRHYSRSDFIVADDGIYFLEVNTLPGLTKASLIPKALHTVGGTMEHFLDHLLTEALESRSVVMR